MISTTRHRLSFDSGRVSMMRTVSPVLAWFSSSCAFSFLVRRTILPYTGCCTLRSIETTTVFCILSLTTIPTRVLRELRCVVALSFLCTSAIKPSYSFSHGWSQWPLCDRVFPSLVSLFARRVPLPASRLSHPPSRVPHRAARLREYQSLSRAAPSSAARHLCGSHAAGADRRACAYPTERGD